MIINWQTKKLSEICIIELGKTPFRGNYKFWDERKDTSNVWLSIADLLNANDKIISDSKEYISDNGAKLCKIVKKGTLLASFKLTLGRLAFAGKDLYTNEAIAALTIKDDTEISKQYLYYFLTNFDWHGEVKGDIKIKGKTLNKAKLKEILISFPSLIEQQRIVKILDEVFENIAKSKENAEKNLANSKELFESYSQNLFARQEKGWEYKKLGEILEIERGGSPRPIEKYLTTASDGINWIKIGDTKTVDKYIFSTRQKISCDGLKKSRLVNPGDFILSNSMSFGRPYIMQTTGAIHDGWLVLREKNKNIIDKDYLYNILNSSYVFKQFNELAAGSTVRNLNISLVSTVLIPLPSILEQKSIVTKLDALYSEIKKLESIYKQKIADLDELKKSILQKAFAGEL